MILARTVVVTDPFARANVFGALTGAGAPAGVTACLADGDSIVVSFDADRTPVELIDALVAVAEEFVPGRAPEIGDLAAATAVAARALNEPGLDPARIIETYLP